MAPASSPYLYETRFQYTSLATFYGSDYFFARMGSQISTLPKRLGDAYMDTALVDQAVIQQTGQRFLNSSYTSDSQQMKALLDNAVAEASAEHLQVGQALSSSQIAHLSSDMVWYVGEQVNGQTVLVPTLYLADSAKIANSGASIAAGGNTSLTASSVANQNGAITAAKNLAVTASESITDVSGLLSAGGNVALTAKTGDVTIATATETLTGASGIDRTLLVGKAAVTAGGNVTVSAGNDIALTGAGVTAGGGAALVAGHDVTVAANTLVHDEVSSDSRSHSELHDVTHDTSSISAGQGLTVMAGNDVTVAGSTLTAGGDVAMTAGHDITLSAVTNSSYSESDSKKTGGFMNSSKSRSESQTVTNQVATVSGGGNVTLTSGNDLTLQAAQVAAGQNLSLNAGGVLSLLSATDSSYASSTSSKSSALWQSAGQHGHSDTTVKMTGLTSGGTLSLNAGKGIVADYKATGDLKSSLAALAQNPQTTWVAQLATRDAVTWNAVQEAHSHWDHQSQGLSGLASAIIAIAVAAATGGAGIGAMLADAAGMAGSATAGAAFAAGFSSLVSQASVSLISNRGDLGKTLQDLGSVDTVKNLAISMAEAGAFAEVGNLTDGHFDHVVQNADGTTSLTNSAGQTASAYAGTTNYALNVVGHAAVGCAVGAAQGGSCGSGAAAAAVSAAAAPATVSSGLAAGTALSATVGGATAKLTGGNAAQGALTGAYGYLYNASVGGYSSKFDAAQTPDGIISTLQGQGTQIPSVTLMAGGAASAAAGTGVEVSGGVIVNPGTFDAGAFVSGGATGGLNISSNIFIGYVAGPTENIFGKSVNQNFSVGPFSITTFHDFNTSQLIGGTVGLGAGTPRFGYSGALDMTHGCTFKVGCQ